MSSLPRRRGKAEGLKSPIGDRDQVEEKPSKVGFAISRLLLCVALIALIKFVFFPSLDDQASITSRVLEEISLVELHAFSKHSSESNEHVEVSPTSFTESSNNLRAAASGNAVESQFTNAPMRPPPIPHKEPEVNIPAQSIEENHIESFSENNEHEQKEEEREEEVHRETEGDGVENAPPIHSESEEEAAIHHVLQRQEEELHPHHDLSIVSSHNPSIAALHSDERDGTSKIQDSISNKSEHNVLVGQSLQPMEDTTPQASKDSSKENEHNLVEKETSGNEEGYIPINRPLWRIALGAAVPRGKEKEGGKVVARLASYESKRVGPRRHDGKSFKAGEAGCPEVPKLAVLPGGPFGKGDQRLKTIHFVHPPKSGGTTFGQVVISSACELNKEYSQSLDCCADPHDWCGENCSPIPECKAVFGCTLCDCHHIPRLNRMIDATYSVTIIRHPMTRYVSGFFYRAHSPNWDRFNLRPGYFSKDPTYPFKFSFEDYLPMPEYHNILVKMFARDQFPYFNTTLTSEDLNKSKKILSQFAIVGINEAYDASVQLMMSIFGISLRDDQIHLPAAMTSTYSNDHEKFKADLRTNKLMEARIYHANQLDVELYEWAVVSFCEKLCAYHLHQFDKRGVCKCDI